MPNIRLVTFAGETVSPIDDALVYQTAIGDSGIIYGANVTLADTNTLHISAGYGIASGRFFEIFDSDVIVPLSSSGTLRGQLYVHMDLGSASEPIQILYQTASTLSPMQQDANVNVVNGVFEFQLATFNINTSAISGLAYTAPIVAGSGSGLIGTAENSNRASKAYAVGDLMIWDNKLWKVTTAIARNGTITTAKLSGTTIIDMLGGFSFGFTAQGKPGYLAPGADTVRPFSGELKSGEALLVAINSKGAQFYWSYWGSYTTDGFMHFDNLDFSNVKSFVFEISSPVNPVGAVDIRDSGGTLITSAVSGTCNVNGRTGVSIRARASNGTGGAPARKLRFLSYVDMNDETHTL